MSLRRKVYYEGSIDDFENPQGAPESREAQGAYRMELVTSDQWAFEYSSQAEVLRAPFTVTPDLTIPPGDYDFLQDRFLLTTSPQRPVSGTLDGGFYGGTLREVTWRGRVEFGPRFLLEPTVVTRSDAKGPCPCAH